MPSIKEIEAQLEIETALMSREPGEEE